MGTVAVLTRLRQETLWRGLPSGVEPTTIWPAWPLERISRALSLRPGELLVDIGTGRGDIGIWIASHAGVRFVGVEPSAVGREAATARAAGSGIDGQIVDGHFAALPVDDGIADAVLVVDAFQFAVDRVVALREMVRVLRPGGQLVILGPWNLRHDPEAEFAQAGLQMVERTETPDWRRRQSEFIAELAAREQQVRAEAGDEVFDSLLARVTPELQTRTWHGLVVGRR